MLCCAVVFVTQTLGPPSRAASPVRISSLHASERTATTTTLLGESFSAGITSPNLWAKFGDACLTAGTGATPNSSIGACGSKAPRDASGQGALQLTTNIAWRYGMVVANVPLPTANGLQITFTDYAFHGTSPGAEGLAFFLTDASQPLPTRSGVGGAALAYGNTKSGSGIPNAYVGVGFDEYGAFSNLITGDAGGVGTVPETIAVRGSAATGYRYLGGLTDGSGHAASLPFALDNPAAQTRPANAPTIQATLTAAGLLTVAIDRHDGAGFRTYFSQTIVGSGGQGAVPAHVYFGLSASAGSSYSVHQVSGLSVTTAPGATVAPVANNPPELVSANGSLTFDVSAQTSATGVPQFVYNGSNTPPTLRLLPGDTLNVNFTNNLPVPAGGSGYTNNSNLHYHGLHVSPQAPGDDSIDMLAAPGQTLHYHIAIPNNHPPGLYWYHTHAHGEAERQTLAGMSGALIIDGIAAYTPAVANMPERVLVVRDAPVPGAPLPKANATQLAAMRWSMQHGIAMHGAAPVAMMGSMRMAAGARRDITELRATSTARTRNPYALVDPKYRRFVRPLAASAHCVAGNPEAPAKVLTLNGLSAPSLRIAPGEQQFWRVVNAGADTYLDLQVDNSAMQIIALDGVPLASGIGTPASMTVSHWVLPPASRVEFIVTGPAAGTTAYLRTNCFDPGPAGSAMPAAQIASIDPSGASTVTSAVHSRSVARSSANARRFRFHTAAAIRSAAVSATRTIFYSDQNTINGVAYDPAAPPQFYAQSGTVEEWTIQNDSSQVHTFHIHQVHFVVEAINGTPQSQQFVMDNVNVPAGNANGPGSVKLLLDFTDPTIIGTFLLHCHILSHEDSGMMAKIRIGTAPPLGLSASTVSFTGPTAAMQTVTVSGGALPYSVTGCAGVADAAVNGSTIGILPAGAGACVLTIADASNPSLTSTLAVSVSAGAPAMTLRPTAVSFAGTTASPQAVTVSGGTAPYTVSGCANVAGGTVAQAVITVTPIAAGACSLTISDTANNQATLAVSVNASTTGNPLDNLTFHQNSMRTGWYNNETTLTTANVGSASFSQVGTLAAPSGYPNLGKVYAQPLFVTAETAVDGKAHNLVIVAGSADRVYAFDETSRAVVWYRDFTSAKAGVRQQLWSDSGCSDVNPDDGIVGTPVIDRSRDTMYVVVATMENGVPYMRLHAIALGSGADRVAPTVIAGNFAMATGGVASISSVANMNRAALLEANGNVYVALASHCDFKAGLTHGWVVAYSAATLQETGNLADLTNADDGSSYFLGAPWMGGFGPAADPQGNVYFATGNGPFNGTTDFSMSVLKVPGNLNLSAASFFTPIQAAVDSNADADLGSGGVMLLPDQAGGTPHLLVAGGKCSANGLGCFKYILNRDALGGQRQGNAGAVWSADTGGGIGGGMRGGPAYFVDSTGTQHVVYGSGHLNTYKLNTAPFGLVKQSSTSVSCFICKDSGSQEIVSSNGTKAGTAIVWAMQGPSNAGGTMTLYAFDALNMGTTLFHGVAGSWTAAPGTSYIGGAMISPLVANGRVYAPAQDAVTVFGLK